MIDKILKDNLEDGESPNTASIIHFPYSPRVTLVVSTFDSILYNVWTPDFGFILNEIGYEQFLL